MTDRDELPKLDLEVDLDLDLDLETDADVDVEGPEATGATAEDADGPVETDLGDGQLAYDCAAWAGESRSMLTSLLTTTGVAHAWQGTMLTGT